MASPNSIFFLFKASQNTSVTHSFYLNSRSIEEIVLIFNILRIMETFHFSLYLVYLKVMNMLSIILLILHFHVYCTHDYVLYILSAACGSEHEGVWELSDNTVSYYEKLSILDAVSIGTGVHGMRVQFVYSAAISTQK